MIDRRLDAVLFDIGGTLVVENPLGTPTAKLDVELLPGVAEDLATLATRFRLGAATNTATMTEADVRALLRRVGIDHLFEVVVTSADIGIPKPDPAILRIAQERLCVTDPARVLYVGNADTDHEAAAASGMHFAFIQSDGVLSSVERWARQLAD